jgi:ArsR family transcriptional regulator
MEQLVAMLRAAGDATRLRLLLLLREAELTVTELTQILGQSQPRVSRHLKLLCEAGLIERFKEGSWVFYRADDRGAGAAFSQTLELLADSSADAVLANDRRHLAAVRAARARAAQAYFTANAPQWERLRSLHAPENDVESAVVELLTGAQAQATTPSGESKPALGDVLDAGTGTGRLLELLAPHIARGTGIDISPEMLAIARDRLAGAGMAHCQVRLGDVYRLPFRDGDLQAGFDAVLFYQVLHYLDDPQAALREAIRVMKPGGFLSIADFAPHSLEFLRNDHAHRRLGFSSREVQSWFKSAGLKPVAERALTPRSGAEQLTVMLWLAQLPNRARRSAPTLKETVA